MDTQSLKAEHRSGTGKGVANRLRARGQIPAIFYGPGVDPVPLAVSPRELERALDTPHGTNTVIKLQMSDGREELSLVKEAEREPVSDELRHVDFYRVQLGHPVEVEVPFRTKGRAVGVQKGGTLHAILRFLPVRAAPELIPSAIEVDVTRMEINEVVRVQDLGLAEGVTVLRSPQQTLVTIISEERKGGAEAGA